MSYLQSIKLARQICAYESVKSVSINKKEYKSVVERMGMMIYSNGLISTLCQLKIKNSVIYGHIGEWIKKQKSLGFNIQDNIDLLDHIVQIRDSRVLLALTIETLKFTDALKEMVKSEIE